MKFWAADADAADVAARAASAARIFVTTCR